MMEKRKKKKKRGNFKPYNKSISTRSQKLLNLQFLFPNFYFKCQFTSSRSKYVYKYGNEKEDGEEKREREEEISWIKSTYYNYIIHHPLSNYKISFFECRSWKGIHEWTKDKKIDEERKKRRDKKKKRETLKLLHSLRPFGVFYTHFL